MGDVKEMMDNVMSQCEDTANVVHEILLQCIGTFLLWFVTVFAIGLAILVIFKLFQHWFIN